MLFIPAFITKYRNPMQLFLSEACSRDYPMMLSVFSNMLTKESDLRVIDNLCAALCRMIMTNVDAVPLEQVYLQLARLPRQDNILAATCDLC